MTIPAQTRRRQQQLARWAKRAPGYRLALEKVLPRIRRSPVLTDLAWRIFAPRHGAGHVDVALHGGRHVGGADVSRLPVVGVLALDLDPTEAEGLVGTVAELQRRTASFRPVLILDQPVFATARAEGYVVEHLVPRQAWSTGDFGGGRWEDYLARRVASITDHYQLWHLARVVRDQVDGTPRLDPVDEAVVHALADRLPDTLALDPRPGP